LSLAAQSRRLECVIFGDGRYDLNYGMETSDVNKNLPLIQARQFVHQRVTVMH